jgi:hypothetical protein
VQSSVLIHAQPSPNPGTAVTELARLQPPVAAALAVAGAQLAHCRALRGLSLQLTGSVVAPALSTASEITCTHPASMCTAGTEASSRSGSKQFGAACAHAIINTASASCTPLVRISRMVGEEGRHLKHHHQWDITHRPASCFLLPAGEPLPVTTARILTRFLRCAGRALEPHCHIRCYWALCPTQHDMQMCGRLLVG